MCTLTYIPRSDDSFVLTSNRDEGVNRKGATLPQVKNAGEKRLLAPIDGEAGGSWITLSEDQRIAVLLNGAFDRHEHDPPYRKSRGLVIMDTFGYDNFSEFFEDYGLEDIEPFTMATFTFRNEMDIKVLRWDGEKKHVEEVAGHHSHIWLAPMLYPPKSREQAVNEFREFLQKDQSPSNGQILDFHEYQDYQTKMKRHGCEPVDVVQTLSTSQITVDGHDVNFKHIDRRVNVTASYKLEI